jgi:predicted DNA-binding transcriptional regulator YafY
VETRRIKQMIIQYVGLSNADTAVDRATSLLVRGHGAAALVNVVRLQQCIEHRKVARIHYQKQPDEPAKDYDIQPYTLFQSESTWRILAGHEGIAKQYLLTKIRSVSPTDRSFRGIERELIEEMFRTSFRSWLGPEQHRILLLLSPEWAARLRPMQLVETQQLRELKDGSAELEATVSSLDEVAAWVVGRGAGVTVLEPGRLKEKVLALARGALQNY